MTSGMIWAWHMYIFFKIKKITKNYKKTKKNKKKSQNDTWRLPFTSVNYFNGVSEKDQIEKSLPILGSNWKKKINNWITLKKSNKN